MSYGVVFIRIADEEYEHAIDWYFANAPGQVERFEAEFAAAISRIQQRPILAKPSYASLRRMKVDDFPYQIWYRVLEEANLVEVLAVLHSAQDQTRMNAR